jgi:hypothetical protein
MIRRRQRSSEERRAAALQSARDVLRAISAGSRDPYEGYREVYGIYIASSGALEELKPLFRLPGIEPDGCIHVDEKFHTTVVSAALEWIREDSKQVAG